jgi:uncharacterized protein
LHENLFLVRLLLSAGADPNIRGKGGRMILYDMHSEHSYEMLKVLIEHGKTPLMLAAQMGDTKQMKHLLQNGTSMDARDIIEGNTALGDAFFTGKIKAAELLIQEGADANILGSMGMTPLIWAVRAGDTALALLLISKGADPAGTDAAGRTALEHGMEMEHPDIIQLLKLNMEC